MVILVFFVDILQLPQTVISNSEKLTHPSTHAVLCRFVFVCFILYNTNFMNKLKFNVF